MTYFAYMDSPVGRLKLEATDMYLCSLHVVKENAPYPDTGHPLLSEAIRQLDEYFKGKRTDFDLPLKQEGTPFQQRVWNELLRIPYGRTISYQDLARRCGSPKACRAVGSANGKNKICLIVPCHRVIKNDGTIGGYAYGTDMKRFLVELESSK